MNDIARKSNELKAKFPEETPALTEEDKALLAKAKSLHRRTSEEEVSKNGFEHMVAIQKENHEKSRKLVSTELTNEFVDNLSSKGEKMMIKSDEFGSKVGGHVDERERQMMLAIHEQKDQLDRDVEMGIMSADEAKEYLEKFKERQKKRFAQTESLAEMATETVTGLYKTGFAKLEVAKQQITKE